MHINLGLSVPPEMSVTVSVAVKKAIDLFDLPTDSIEIRGHRSPEGAPRITAKLFISGEAITDLVFDEHDINASAVKQAQLIVTVLNGKSPEKPSSLRSFSKLFRRCRAKVV
jgi:hypothetical protein